MATISHTNWVDRHIAYGLRRRMNQSHDQLVRVGFPDVLAKIIAAYAIISPRLIAFIDTVAPGTVILRDGAGPDACVWTLACEPSGAMFKIRIGLTIGNMTTYCNTQYMGRQRLLLFLVGEAHSNADSILAKKITIRCLEGSRIANIELAKEIVTRLLDMLRVDIITQFNMRPKKAARSTNRPPPAIADANAQN
jgi:hypothetical protein